MFYWTNWNPHSRPAVSFLLKSPRNFPKKTAPCWRPPSIAGATFCLPATRRILADSTGRISKALRFTLLPAWPPICAAVNDWATEFYGVFQGRLGGSLSVRRFRFKRAEPDNEGGMMFDMRFRPRRER